MTDLQLIDQVCEQGVDLINPVLFRELESRRLVHYFNYLGTRNVDECKAIIRARMSKNSIYTGDQEIERISQAVLRLEVLRGTLNKMQMTDAQKVVSILTQMQEQAQYIRDYFKPVHIP